MDWSPCSAPWAGLQNCCWRVGGGGGDVSRRQRPNAGAPDRTWPGPLGSSPDRDAAALRQLCLSWPHVTGRGGSVAYARLFANPNRDHRAGPCNAGAISRRASLALLSGPCARLLPVPYRGSLRRSVASSVRVQARSAQATVRAAESDPLRRPFLPADIAVPLHGPGLGLCACKNAGGSCHDG
jgi:hypothetical protein